MKRVHLLLMLLTAQPLFAAVPVIQNPDSPSGQNRVVSLEELWRIGGLEDEENLLGVVDKALADDQGNVYLMDVQLTEIQVFSPEGEHMRSLGRAGDGPGEIRRLGDFVFLPDGTVGLIQAFPGKIIQVDMTGSPAGERRPGGDDPSAGGFFALRGAASWGSTLVLSGARISRNAEKRLATQFIASFDETDALRVTFARKSSERTMGPAPRREADDYFPHDGGWTLGPDGRVYIAPLRNEYRIEVMSPSGQLEKVITRPYQSLERTAEEREIARQQMTPRRRRNRSAPDIVVEPTVKDILSMRVAEDGRLWVLASRGIKNQPEGIHSTWDVFDSGGTFIETISLACEGRGSRDAIFFAGSGLVILVKEHAQAMQAFRGQTGQDEESELDAAPLEVVCYRWQP